MPIKFNIDGTTSTSFQIGKKGGRFKYLNDEFFVTDDTDNFYVKIHGGYPTENSHLATKAYVDNQVPSVGKIVTGEFPTSSEWILNHNLASTPIIWNTFDDRDEAIIPDRVDVSNPNIVYFYFTPDTAGSAIVASGFVTQDSEKFYGITISETDGSPSFSGINTIKFLSTEFYLTQNSPNTDEVIVNLRPSQDKYRYIVFGGNSGVGGNTTTRASYGNNVAIGDPTMAFPGSVVALTLSLSQSRTNGTITLRVRKNNVAQTGAGQTIVLNTSVSRAFGILSSPITYVPGDSIGLETVTVGFTPTGSDATMVAYCEEAFN